MLFENVTSATVLYSLGGMANRETLIGGSMRCVWIRYVQERLEECALPYLAGALSGDIESAEQLIVAAGNENRGRLAVALWRCRIAPVAYRKILSGAWAGDHGPVIRYANHRRTLHAMFRYAAFPTEHLPDQMTVWRGVSGVTPKVAAAGYSWTA